MKKFIPIILLLVIAGGALGYYMYNKPHAETKDAAADVTISPAELLAIYDQDEAKANEMYLDKIIEVEGTVKEVNLLESGGSITLDTGNDMSAIICEFESGDALGSVKAGDIVKVKGFCSGKLMDIVLVRCSM